MNSPRRQSIQVQHISGLKYTKDESGPKDKFLMDRTVQSRRTPQTVLTKVVSSSLLGNPRTHQWQVTSNAGFQGGFGNCEELPMWESASGSARQGDEGERR